MSHSMGPAGDASPQQQSGGNAPGMEKHPQDVHDMQANKFGYSLSYEELHKKTIDVLPTCFEGAKVAVTKGLSHHFQISHTLTLSEMANGYRFGATFVGTKMVGKESFPILLGDMDLSGNSNAMLIHQFDNNLRLKAQTNTQKSQLVNSSLSLERAGRLSSLCLKAVNPSLLTDSVYLSASYLRRITERLDVGAEYIYQRDQKIPGNQVSALSYALRYTTPNWTLAATAATRGIHLSYHHKQTENLQFAVDFDSNFQAQECVTTFGYQVDIPDTMTLRASLDTNWTVGAVLEKKLSRQLPFTFVLSGMLNQAKALTKFGIGLVIG